jgi:hypothetical protein
MLLCGALPSAPTGISGLLHDVLRKPNEAQFIISSHSPVLLGYPGAQILSFDGGRIGEIEYEQTAFMQIVRRFLNDRGHFLEELLKDTLRCSKKSPEISPIGE